MHAFATTITAVFGLAVAIVYDFFPIPGDDTFMIFMTWAFITWTFQPGNTELGGKKTNAWEYLRTLAVTRIYLDNIEHIQGSWVTQGQETGQITLAFGANDLGSIMLEENVVRAAGTAYEMSINKMVNLITASGKIPAQRDTEYNIIKKF